MNDLVPTAHRPNVVLVLADDLGFSDLGCYGGEIDTPALDELARKGLRFSSFYNTARCSPSRASLLTGLHPHQTGVGILNDDDRPVGYAGTLNSNCVTISEVLAHHGYATYMSGKWHLTGSLEHVDRSWPTDRGFDKFYGTIQGAGSYFHPQTLTRGDASIEREAHEPGYYLTDAISSEAVSFLEMHAASSSEQPFFLYLAYTAPHWPLHALADDIERYRHRYDEGWDSLRTERMRHLLDSGLVSNEWQLSQRDPHIPPWESVSDREWQSRRMEVYAAQIDRMDKGIGRVVAALGNMGALDDTIFVFLSDNGGSAEEVPNTAFDSLRPGLQPLVRSHARGGAPVMIGNTPGIVPGAEDTFASYGRAWANVSNAPFREYKHWVHEGGIATPFIVHWPSGIGQPGSICHTPYQLPDVMATIIDATKSDYLERFCGHSILPVEGVSMLPDLRGSVSSGQGHALYWEHEGNKAVRIGDWKLVSKFGRPWELYDMAADRTELVDEASGEPDVVHHLASSYAAWADRCGVIPYERIVAEHRRAGVDRSGTD